MAKYLQDAVYTADIIKKLNNKHPGIIDDPDIYSLVYSSVRAMPRVQGTVRRGFVQEVARRTGTQKVSLKRDTSRNERGEEYEVLEITSIA